MQSPFEGRLIRLRAREPADAPQTWAWLNDPEVTRHILVRYPQSGPGQQLRAEENPAVGYINGRFAIETLAEGRYIGNCALRTVAPENRGATLAITIGDKAYWDGGYGTDTMRTLCRFGFEHMNLHRIELEVFENNPRGLRAYEKVGFEIEGTLRQADYRYGRYRNVVLMGLLEGELIPDSDKPNHTRKKQT